jgi:hypothetical protein
VEDHPASVPTPSGRHLGPQGGVSRKSVWLDSRGDSVCHDSQSDRTSLLLDSVSAGGQQVPGAAAQSRSSSAATDTVAAGEGCLTGTDSVGQLVPGGPCEWPQQGDSSSGGGAQGGGSNTATGTPTSGEGYLTDVDLVRQLVPPVDCVASQPACMPDRLNGKDLVRQLGARLSELLADKNIVGEADRPAAWMHPIGAV